jgi:hypothetical protein
MQTLQELIEARDVGAIKAYMAEHRLVVDGNKIVPIDANAVNSFKSLESFWNQQQQIKKILLNSLYGALLNKGLRFYDERVGQSVTLTGRSIVRHMNAKSNEAVTGKYNYTGEAIVYADTDSVAPNTMVRTSKGEMQIQELFDQCQIKWSMGDKQYATDDRFMVLSGSLIDTDEKFTRINYVYRHKTKKRRFAVHTTGEKTVVVTENHSLMIQRDNDLVEIKPMDLKQGDRVLVINTPTHSIGVYNDKKI